jgi:transcriptional regulator with PAS, ATPase and Fis domain
MKLRRIYLSWHYTTHGVAYLKHVLSAFHSKLSSIDSQIHIDGIDQIAMNGVFDNRKRGGFVFDEVILLTAPQAAFDSISSRRFSHVNSMLDDKAIVEAGISDILKDILANESLRFDLRAQEEFIRKTFPDKLDEFLALRWRTIQHYPINQQLMWLTEDSNFSKVYQDKLAVRELQVSDLRDEQQIVKALEKWLQTLNRLKSDETEFIVNVSLGSSETQVAWHVLAESNRLPKNVRFIKTYDDKSDNLDNRFKRFSIKEITVNLISQLTDSLRIYDNPKSEKRKLVSEQFKVFLKSGFSIFILGERGTGKSRLAKEGFDTSIGQHPKANKDGSLPKLVEANCASFPDDDKAESELFGYVEGAFTDANKKGRSGLLEKANGGVLFLDEIHHLSKSVQAKLMKAFQTDSENRMTIRPMGSDIEKVVKCNLIFASNQSIDELRELLLPDFYDRIVQHVVVIPPLRETREDVVTDWQRVWAYLKFGNEESAPSEAGLIKWLKELPLYGNFRDLQKIAMYYQVFNDLPKDARNEKTALDYAKAQFKAYHSAPDQISSDHWFNFSEKLTTKQMIQDYLFELQDWATKRFGSHKKACEHFNGLGDKVKPKSLYEWRERLLYND